MRDSRASEVLVAEATAASARATVKFVGAASAMLSAAQRQLEVADRQARTTEHRAEWTRQRAGRAQAQVMKTLEVADAVLDAPFVCIES